MIGNGSPFSYLIQPTQRVLALAREAGVDTSSRPAFEAWWRVNRERVTGARFR